MDSTVSAYGKNIPQFYITPPQPCPYLSGQFERKIFTHLIGDRARELNDSLSQGGFRRSQNIAYRPACEECTACISVRVIVDEFRYTKSFRRTMRKNTDLVGKMEIPTPTSENYSIFRDYIDHRHTSGGMTDMTVLDFAAMVEDTFVNTRLIEYRKKPDQPMDPADGKKGELVAAALSDIMEDGLSMIYSFFNPAYEDRGLGTYMILDHIERARKMGLPFLYLGYWVQGSAKMTYKSRFSPQERLDTTGWHRVQK